MASESSRDDSRIILRPVVHFPFCCLPTLSLTENCATSSRSLARRAACSARRNCKELEGRGPSVNRRIRLPTAPFCVVSVDQTLIVCILQSQASICGGDCTRRAFVLVSDNQASIAPHSPESYSCCLASSPVTLSFFCKPHRFPYFAPPCLLPQRTCKPSLPFPACLLVIPPLLRTRVRSCFFMGRGGCPGRGWFGGTTPSCPASCKRQEETSEDEDKRKKLGRTCPSHAIDAAPLDVWFATLSAFVFHVIVRNDLFRFIVVCFST